MPITPRPVFEEQLADVDTAFDVTLAVTDTAEDFVTVPAPKLGRILSFVNEGPGAVAIKANADAVVTDLLLEEGDTYSEARLEVSTRFSFINIDTGDQPRVRGVLWSGD